MSTGIEKSPRNRETFSHVEFTITMVVVNNSVEKIKYVNSRSLLLTLLLFGLKS